MTTSQMLCRPQRRMNWSDYILLPNIKKVLDTSQHLGTPSLLHHRSQVDVKS